MSNPSSNSPASNPWKAVAIVIAVAALLLAVGVVLATRGDRSEEPASAPIARSAAPERVAAPARVVEDCNTYAAETGRDKTRILRDAVVGGAAGAGVGAAGGAIADGGEGAGKGAGIGAIVGATAGTLYGLNEENKKSEQARIAYQQCMARRGY